MNTNNTNAFSYLRSSAFICGSKFWAFLSGLLRRHGGSAWLLRHVVPRRLAARFPMPAWWLWMSLPTNCPEDPSLLLGIDQNASEMFWAVRFHCGGYGGGISSGGPNPDGSQRSGSPAFAASTPHRPGSAVTPRRLVVMPSRDHAGSADVYFANPFAALPALRETLEAKTFRAKTPGRKGARRRQCFVGVAPRQRASFLPGLNSTHYRNAV